MRYVVTGAAGFIGSHFTRGLVMGDIGRATSVTALDKLTYAGNAANLADIRRDITFVHGDVCDAEVLDELLPGIDVVVNFAAESHVDRSIADAAHFMMTNVVGVQTLFDACRRHRVSRVVHIGTDEVYGSIHEGSWTEDSPLEPNSPYAASKASAELLVRAYARTHGLPVMSTRCTNNYGSHQFPEKAIPLFVTNLLEGRQIPLYGSGEHRRDWLHVRDHCRAIDIVIRHGEPGRSYNVGGGTELSNRELVTQLLSLMGRTWSDVEAVPDRPGHDRRYSVDDSRLRRLGYSPRVPFDAGLAETVAWYLAHEEWWRPLMTGVQASRASA